MWYGRCRLGIWICGWRWRGRVCSCRRSTVGGKCEEGRREQREGNTQGQTVSETMEMLKLVILRAVARKAAMMDAGDQNKDRIGDLKMRW